jgi:toxin ParE1/3/4
MRYRPSRSAERELDAIFVYWAKRAGLEIAVRIVDEIEASIAQLADSPEIGRKCDEYGPGTRCLVAGNYLVYYRKKHGVISILHIIHGARDQKRAFFGDKPR